MRSDDALFGPIPGADHRDFVGVSIDVVRAGNARVKRSIYPVGFHWARDIKPKVGTAACEHAHVGFLARGSIHMTFEDGCTRDFTAPQVIVIEPGHDGRVVGNEPAVVIEFDFENDTCAKVGIPARHEH